MPSWDSMARLNLQKEYGVVRYTRHGQRVTSHEVVAESDDIYEMILLAQQLRGTAPAGTGYVLVIKSQLQQE